MAALELELVFAAPDPGVGPGFDEHPDLVMMELSPPTISRDWKILSPDARIVRCLGRCLFAKGEDYHLFQVAVLQDLHLGNSFSE